VKYVREAGARRTLARRCFMPAKMQSTTRAKRMLPALSAHSLKPVCHEKETTA